MNPVEPLTKEDEEQRLQALLQYAVLDSLPEQGYEDVTRLAAFICGTPISLVSLVDKDRQWFKSARGLDATETPRSQSFCANTLVDAQTLIVEDARADTRFKDNPLVLGNPNIRFYAGAPIIDGSGHVLGTVCVIDTKPRVLSSEQIDALEALSRQVMVLLEQRRAIVTLEDARAAAQAAQRTVQENENRLQTLVDSVSALAWVADADGAITWYNRRWYQYTGTTREDMEGWGWRSVHDPVVLPLVVQRWTDSIATGEPFEMVFPLRGADGVFRSFMTRVNPLRDEGGAVVQWFGTNTEVDELQRTRQSLEENESILRQVMNATSDAVVSVDRNWTLTYLNPVAERLYGSAELLRGRNLWEAFPGIVYEGSPFEDGYRQAMDDGIACRFEAQYDEPLKRTVDVEAYPGNDGIVIFSRDITKLKLAAAVLMQTEKLAAVGRLASSIAHEINNPLESVTNLLYLARTTSDPVVLDQYLDGAERELRRVSAIASQTLRFHKQSTRPTPVKDVDLFDDTLQLYQGKLINSNIQVHRRMRATCPALCFEGEIRQVLSNLIGNAIDAMQLNGGELYLRSRDGIDWRTGQKGLAITVADTGIGMSPLVREQIFDAFFSTKGIGGTGLGLWVSQEIVERHRGTLSVRSSDRKTAHGSAFVLFLPYQLADA